jgi:hypothetical protein
MHISNRRLLKSNWLRLLDGIPFTHEITFNFGITLSTQAASEKMEALCKRIERKAFGGKWHQKEDGRLTVIAFPENVDSNTHFHAFAKVTAKLERALERHGSTIWSKITPRGQLHTKPLRNVAAAKNYFTKQLRTNDRLDAIYLYVGSRGFCRQFERGEERTHRSIAAIAIPYHDRLPTVAKSGR